MKKKEQILVEKLTNLNDTIATAESCTGGLVAAAIVNVSGASNVFERGYITYADIAKEEELGVEHELLTTKGAVSEETAAKMAEGCMRRAGAGMGLSTTGIAGPTGGTPQKPTGLVYIGCSIKENTWVLKCHFKGDRDAVRKQAVERALSFACECLDKELQKE